MSIKKMPGTSTTISSLLKLSYDINNVRSRDDLIKVINNSVSKLFAFENITILLLNEDPQNNSYLLASPLPTTFKSPDKQELSDPNQTECICRGFEMTAQSGGILILDLEDYIKNKTCTSYLKYEYKYGIRQKIILILKGEEKILGLLCINTKVKEAHTKQTLELIKGVAYQISFSVTNILANEEIEKRENEKSKLLSFSNEVASVRDKIILSKILKQQLKHLFDINEYVIHVLNATKTKHTPLLFDDDADFSKHPDFKKMLGVETDIHDGIFDVILSSEKPVYFKIDDWTKLPNQPTYANAANAEDLKTMVGVSIKLGAENIAVMNFKHNNFKQIQQDYTLFRSILSQIAIIVSNINANEKIIHQLSEINNYKLLLEQEKTYLQEEIDITHNYTEIIGESPEMQKVFRLIGQVAHSDSTVLLLGETGTGKELVARAIHNNSPRKNKLMVKVNCAALPANLIESELFGHEKGSFTGATERRLGKFELANGGTLFLDEIGEMPLELQVKLLRALQEREIERIGGRTVIKVDVRIIAATNRNLEKEMGEGRFRNDLYYRLNIFPITLPALRERREDLPLLVSYFINRFGKKAGRKISSISTRAMQDITMYNWPGNIRELEHLIERSILLSDGEMLKTVHLPSPKKISEEKVEKNQFLIKSINDNDRELILETLKYCNGRVGGYSGAAELLAVPPSTLFSKMKKLGIRRNIA